jgi:hypothetical protein
MDDRREKGPFQTTDAHDSIELENATAVGEKDGTRNDENDMDRMGRIQVLRVSVTKLFDDVSMYSHRC